MRCPRKQGFLCAERHQVSQLSDLGVIEILQAQTQRVTAENPITNNNNVQYKF